MSLSVNSKFKTAAKVAAGVAAGAAVVGGAVYLAKSGRFAQVKNMISDSFQSASKGNPNLTQAQNNIHHAAEKAKGFGHGIVNGAKNVFDRISGFFRGVTPEKINPDLADGASKSAETFNNFVKQQ